MEIQHFDDLLAAARAQAQPQRLLMVFVATELPEDASAEQRARFAQGEGGALVPLMCVDKTPEELDSFATLLAESQQFELPYQPWRLVFTAALSGSNGQAPTSEDAESPLERMVESVKLGMFGNLLPFDRQGQPVHFG
ncbi:ribonucleotide reductase subunit alpha [Acidovorax sp. HDW3]|uniref:ribonucleotide reductase subunit alpha n=1 Tax=Acidovorax sp. HDW3 TaxID=2714923 RepID=UPI00140AA33F|nr:ribonucleotide reductase subunit alpha [Acidovorax sp. HDW3]QIL42950.1 ribonucleotide reductase subunit alpha [Acidovorax sp. HDW3]